MRKILLASLFALSVSTVHAANLSWVDVWGNVKNTAGLIVDKTGTSASDAVGMVVESKNKTVEVIKSAHIDFTMTTDSAETTDLKETMAGPWSSVTGLFSSEWQRVIGSHSSAKRAEVHFIEDEVSFDQPLSETKVPHVPPNKESTNYLATGYFDPSVKEINVIEVFD